MTYKNAKVVVMLAALAVGLGATEAFAEIEPPMVQHAHGVPLEQVQCRDSKILMEMTGGTPACVSKETAKKLEQRGLGRIVVSNSNAYVLPEKYSYSGIGESKAHGIEKHYPVLSTVEFPGSISVGQTVSIPYTVSWYHPNGTATHSELGTYGTDNILTHIRIFVPEEFTVLNEDKVFLLRLGDFYAPHSGTTYWIGVRCSEDTVSGSIDLRLDRHISTS